MREKPGAIRSTIAPFSPDLFFDLFSVCLFLGREGDLGSRGCGGWRSLSLSESFVFISVSVVWGVSMTRL